MAGPLSRVPVRTPCAGSTPLRTDSQQGRGFTQFQTPWCQWWTNSHSLVKRSIFMDDWIHGLTDTQLRVAALSNMMTPVRIDSLSGK
jgi:hypothetical protein